MNPLCLSINDLGFSRLRTSPSILKELADQADQHYVVRPRLIAGKWRNIARPDAALMTVQKRICHRLLADVPTSNAVHSVRGRSTYSNAMLHCGQPWVIRIDIRDFYPSVASSRIERLWLRLGYSPKLALLLTKLTTLRARLPIGGATSTALGNLVLANVDEAVEKMACAHDVRYSRWVDDLIISGERARLIIGQVIAAVKSEGFEINRKKLRVAGPGSPHVVTGLMVNASRPTVPRHVRDRLRAMTHNLTKADFGPAEKEELRRSCDGLAGYVLRINPNAKPRLHRYPV